MSSPFELTPADMVAINSAQFSRNSYMHNHSTKVNNALISDPMEGVLLQTRVILNGLETTDFVMIPARRARLMGDILDYLSQHWNEHEPRLWCGICQLLFFDAEHPPDFFLQLKVPRVRDPRPILKTSYTVKWAYFDWFAQYILSGYSKFHDTTPLKVEIHVSNFHLRGELIWSAEPLKKKEKDPWQLRRYVRFAALYEEVDIETRYKEDCRLRSLGQLPPMDVLTQIKVYGLKKEEYDISTFANFEAAPQGLLWTPDRDLEEDTNDEYEGRGKVIEEKN